MLHVSEVNLKLHSQIFIPTEVHLGVVNGSMTWMDDFLLVEMTQGTS